jgi:hypothetical protein
MLYGLPASRCINPPTNIITARLSERKRILGISITNPHKRGGCLVPLFFLDSLTVLVVLRYRVFALSLLRLRATVGRVAPRSGS